MFEFTLKSMMALALPLLLLGACQSVDKNTSQSSDTQDQVIVSDSVVNEDTNDFSEPVIVSGQTLNIIVMGEDDLNGAYQVSSSGDITFPFIGDLHVEGKTIPQINEMIVTQLKDGYIHEPFVKIMMDHHDG